MKSLTSLLFFTLLGFTLLGFSLAGSDLLNPVTAASNADVRQLETIQKHEEWQLQKELMKSQMAMNIEVQLYRSKAISDALFFLSAVFAACLIALTTALFLRLTRTPVEKHRQQTVPPVYRFIPRQPETEETLPLGKRPILKPDEHLL